MSPAPVPPLPPAVRGWPTVLRPAGWQGHGADEIAAALARIRAERLFWPAPRAAAARPRAVALGAEALARARAAFADAEIGRGEDPAAVDADRLEAVFAPPCAALLVWATVGGLATPGAAAAEPGLLLAHAAGVSPWDGGALALGDAVEAQATLRRAALRARGPVGLVAMTPWKRRCLRPFLVGPDGPPRRVRSVAAAEARGLRPVIWGGGGAEVPGALRVEDGFLRSVGLGLRHTPPLSLAIAAGPPHFDATRPNAFEAEALAAEITPDLRARARALRERIVRLRLSKYNLAGAEPLPPAAGRERVLVPGQVSDDAAIRLGARAVRDDAGLLEAARARFPDAFLLYKPHPDVLTGLRPGRADRRTVARFADATLTRASIADCLDWADRVTTITSLTGFEALIRGKAVTTFGRPFYAGWGLTDDADPPARGRALDLDALVAVALILHASYVEPRSGLPATPEAALAALVRERERAGEIGPRLLRLWRGALSSVLARL